MCFGLFGRKKTSTRSPLAARPVPPPPKGYKPVARYKTVKGVRQRLPEQVDVSYGKGLVYAPWEEYEGHCQQGGSGWCSGPPHIRCGPGSFDTRVTLNR